MAEPAVAAVVEPPRLSEPPSASSAPASPFMLWRVLLSNLPFALALSVVADLPAFVQVLIVGAILFFAPGLAWADRRQGDAFLVLFRVVMLSLVAALLTWVVVGLLPGLTSRIGFLLVLAAITNAGLYVGWKRGFYTRAPFADPLFRAIGVVALLFFLQEFVGAAYTIPAMEDQDMETQGTSYGLIHDFSPTMATNRGSRFFFAHPLLLHFYIGASAFITDDLDRLRYFHESSLAVRDGAELGGRWEQDFHQFERDPVLLPTRTPNLFFGVMVLFPLGFLIYRMSRSKVAALGAGVLYATFPEIYVRSAYGGYMAITNFIMLSGAYYYLIASGLLREPGDPAPAAAKRRSFATTFLGAWTNQKAILIPAAAGLHASLLLLLDGGFSKLVARAKKDPLFTTAVIASIGFVVGWFTYATYGVSVAPKDFIADHIRDHIYKRLKMSDVNLKDVQKGAWVYPSIVALWLQFAKHYGWLFFGPAIVAAIATIKRIRRAEGVILFWLAFGALGFSLVDWRQTKHLSKIVPPMVILTALFWASLDGKAKKALSAVLAGAIVWNVWSVVQTMQDFNYIQPLPIW